MRIKRIGDETEILVLVDHPMESGQRIGPRTQGKIPPHFIQKMTFSLNGREVAVADLGSAVSRDPLIKVKMRGVKPGDTVRVTWSDNKGQSGEHEITVT